MATKTKVAPARKAILREVVVRPIEIAEFNVPIKSKTALLMNKKSRQMYEDIISKEGGRAKSGRKPRKPHEEYMAAFHKTSAGKLAIPAVAFKKGISRAALTVEGVKKSNVNASVFVLGDGEGYVVLKKHAKPHMREDMALVGKWGNRQPTMRYRPEIDTWEAVLRIQYRADVITPDQIVNLVNVAGFSVGALDWRPEKEGTHGMYEVVLSKKRNGNGRQSL